MKKDVLSQIASVLLALAVAVAPPANPAPSGPTGAQVWTAEPTATTDVQRTIPRRELAHAMKWQTRDRRLVIATSVSGIVFAASTIAATVLGIEIRKSIDRCSDAPYTQCEAARDRVLQLKTPAIAVASVAGASFVALLVSGIMLAVHRSRRPEIARHGAPRFALSPSGMRLRF